MVSDIRADILLVTATKIETRAVFEAFDPTGQHGIPQSIDGRIYFDLGMVNGACVTMTQSEMGSGGLGASLQAVDKGIAALSPTAVIMVGIAFGVNEEKQSIGDILVTAQLRPYDLERVGTQADGTVRMTLRDDKPHASPWLLNLLKSSEHTWKGAAVHFGTILTGAKLVDNVDFREQLRAMEPEAIGGEMEGVGLYVACHDRKIDWILVKAICDFADGQKAKEKAERQSLAGRNAAAFVHHALHLAPIDWRALEHAASPLSASIRRARDGGRWERSALVVFAAVFAVHSGMLKLNLPELPSGIFASSVGIVLGVGLLSICTMYLLRVNIELGICLRVGARSQVHK